MQEQASLDDQTIYGVMTSIVGVLLLADMRGIEIGSAWYLIWITDAHDIP